MGHNGKMGGKCGFSLIELIVVMAMIAILTGGATLGIRMLRSTDAKNLASEINSSLTTLRSENMAKNEPSYMHLYYYQGKHYIEMSKNSVPAGSEAGRMLGNDSVTVKFKGDTEITLGEGSSGTISFCINKKDGSFVSKVNNTELKVTSEIEVSSDAAPTSYKVVLVRDTGRHYLQ